ncbi:MAG TPA: hypothetical protein VGI40_07200, partial [Pirellulaceae bacterium]
RHGVTEAPQDSDSRGRLQTTGEFEQHGCVLGADHEGHGKEIMASGIAEYQITSTKHQTISKVPNSNERVRSRRFGHFDFLIWCLFVI